MVAFLSKKQMRMVMAILAANKKSLKKSRGVGIVVALPDGKILAGRSVSYGDGQWSLPGGHVEDGEGFESAAIREIREETGLAVSKDSLTLIEDGEKDKSYFLRLGSVPQEVLSSTEELQDIGFYNIKDLVSRDVRACSLRTINAYAEKNLKKSKKLQDMLVVEELNKNILRGGQVADVVYEMTHGDALRLVGNGTFRILKEAVAGMGDDTIKDVKFGTYTLHIRKHSNDVYSGRIDDGIKTIHQFVNRSIPTLTAEVMSVFEWYDEDINSKIEPKIKDEHIIDGVKKLAENYTKHNISDLYQEMESIREEIRNGVAVDVQQIEQRILKVFDKLESTVNTIKNKHNLLAEEADKQLEDIESKLRKLQSKLDGVDTGSGGHTVEVDKNGKVLVSYTKTGKNDRK